MAQFVVFNVELANPDLSSICQLAVVTFEGGKCVETWETLVNPNDYFDSLFSSMHGLDEASVADAPRIAFVAPELVRRLEERVVVTHTAFDRIALGRALGACGRPLPTCRWLDSARVARRAWPGVARGGYGLEPVAAMLGISFQPNRACEDARAAGEVLNKAIEFTGLSLSDWFTRVEQPIAAASIEQSGNPEGPLFGETIVFTGALSLTRAEAAILAANAGCNVEDGVNKRTTLLVIGEQDIGRLAGYVKSKKHRAAEERIARGQDIRILTEPDFQRVVVGI